MTRYRVSAYASQVFEIEADNEGYAMDEARDRAYESEADWAVTSAEVIGQ